MVTAMTMNTIVITGEGMMTGGEMMIIMVGTTNTPLDSAYKNKAPQQYCWGALVIKHSLTLWSDCVVCMQLFF